MSCRFDHAKETGSQRTQPWRSGGRVAFPTRNAGHSEFPPVACYRSRDASTTRSENPFGRGPQVVSVPGAGNEESVVRQ